MIEVLIALASAITALAGAVVFVLKRRNGRDWNGGERRTGMADLRADLTKIHDAVVEVRETVGEIRGEMRLIVYRVDRLERDRP